MAVLCTVQRDVTPCTTFFASALLIVLCGCLVASLARSRRYFATLFVRAHARIGVASDARTESARHALDENYVSGQQFLRPVEQRALLAISPPVFAPCCHYFATRSPCLSRLHSPIFDIAFVTYNNPQ
jgi:hypothetical protein